MVVPSSKETIFDGFPNTASRKFWCSTINGSGFSKARNDLSREQFLAGQVAARQAVETEALAREQKLKDTIRVAEEEAEQQARTIKRLSSTITDHEQRSATMAQILESLERQLKASMASTRQGQPKDSFEKFQTSSIESTRNYYPRRQ